MVEFLPGESGPGRLIVSEIALLRLDTDWYESTRHELEHLYPRLAPGGVLIIDDYGAWQGRALKELAREKLWKSVQRHPAAVTFPEGEGGDRAREMLPRALQQTRDRLCSVGRTVAIGEPIEYVEA